jgi:hypothetical protein
MTAKYLGAYIVDLTLVLHQLFLNTLPMDPPRPLTEELIDNAIGKYQIVECDKAHRRVRNLNPINFERDIGDLIRESLGMNEDNMEG